MTVRPADTSPTTSTSEHRIRVIVVDDDTLVLKVLRSYLDVSPKVELLNTFTSAADAQAFLDRVPADVVLTDARMPGMDGIELLSRLKETMPDIAVIILTSLDDDSIMMDALNLKASGFLLKISTPSTMVDAITAAYNGGIFLTPETTSRLVRHHLKPIPPKTPSNVTETEQAVLDCICGGMSNREIAEHLIVSESTVKVHVSHLMKKFSVTSRLKLAVAAIRTGSSS